jgi:C1A family cysteine protease
MRGEVTTVARSNAHYGWVPDLPDQRDFLYAAPPAVVVKLPRKVDLTSQCAPVYDQGQLGSCTGNGVAGCLQFDAMKEKLPDTSTPSRLFIYYNERVLEGTVASDSGAMIRDGIKSVAETGACDEAIWPYDITAFATKPSDASYQEATSHRAIVYSRVVQTLSQLKGCLASGYPVVFGFTVYESFESPEVASSGTVPMPGAAEKVLGGHCVVAVGYNDSTQRFLIRNSWGTGWGKKGYATMPYAYLLTSSLASDFWTIRSTS